jgi:hypothetical protein
MVLGMCAAAAAPSYAQKPGAAQNRPSNRAPNPPRQQGSQQRQQQPRQAQNQARAGRPQNRNANRPPERNSNRPDMNAQTNGNPSRPDSSTRPNNNPNRPPSAYTPPPRKFNELSPQDKKKVLENRQRLQNLPPAQRQEIEDRGRVWGQMTPVQRDHVRNDVLPKWKQMPPERRQAIQQRLRVLKEMPESARNQRLNDPNFTRGMSEEDKATLRDLSHLHVGGAPDPPSE